MSIAEGLKTTLGIIDLAGSVIDSSNPNHSKAAAQKDWLSDKVGYAARVSERMERTGHALTAFSAQTTILSRVFIDESIIDEPILANLNKSLHSWYAAQIIAALHLSQMVTAGRTVQDIMSVVQTGHNARETSVLGNIAVRNVGRESFLSHMLGDDHIATESSGPSFAGPMDATSMAISEKARADKLQGELDDVKGRTNEVSMRSVNTSDNRIGPMGELYEIKLSNPNGQGTPMTVPVFVQMQPSIIPAEVAPRFIDMNVMPTVWQRWTEMRAGELTFWKDFLLNRDLIRRQKSIIKNPKTAAAFSDFLKTVAKKDKYAIDDATDRLGSRQSSNLANSVIIFSEDTVMQAKADSGIDLHNPRDCVRYFRDTYSMIVVIVDPLHQRVTIYFNGLDGDINASYSDFRPNDQKFDPKDFMQALQAFSTNNIGRLR